MKQAAEVILASGEHTRLMGRAMAKAFQNEPNFTYIIPDETKRERALQWFFGTFTARLGFGTERSTQPVTPWAEQCGWRPAAR